MIRLPLVVAGAVIGAASLGFAFGVSFIIGVARTLAEGDGDNVAARPTEPISGQQ